MWYLTTVTYSMGGGGITSVISSHRFTNAVFPCLSHRFAQTFTLQLSAAHLARSDDLFSQVQLLLETPKLALEQIRKIADTASSYLNDVYNTCPFAVGTAVLSLLRAAQMSSVIQVSDSDFSFLTMDAMKTWDAMNGERVGLKRHFFYDLLTTRWPWLPILA